MKALQYIYTSWKNGDSSEKGYMIYSLSEGISDSDCTAIKDAMQYLPPKELNPAPTPEEIENVFPYSFAYFRLPSGKGCVAQSTYLGKDYSGRYGNYIIHALIFDITELPCRPAELFGEPYIKKNMTEEELSAPSPVPPLPVLLIDSFSDIINDEQISEFIYEREEELALLISYVLEARTRGVPFYLNDTRENLVLWAAAVQRVIPSKLTADFMFNTYIGNHESMRSNRAKEEGLDFSIIGVRPDANFFSYASECRSNRQIVMDFLGGNMTQGISASRYAEAMASSICLDYEEVESFSEFISETSICKIDNNINDAFLFYMVCRYDDLSEMTDEEQIRAMRFGAQYSNDSNNSYAAGQILSYLQNRESLDNIDYIVALWDYVCRYADYMAFTLFDILSRSLLCLSVSGKKESELTDLTNKLAESSSTQYSNFLVFLNNDERTSGIINELNKTTNASAIRFYLLFIFRNYFYKNSINIKKPIDKLFVFLLKKLQLTDNRENTEMRLLIDAASDSVLFNHILDCILDDISDLEHIRRIGDEYLHISESLSENDIKALNEMLTTSDNGLLLSGELCVRKIKNSKDPLSEFWDSMLYLKGHQSDKAACKQTVLKLVSTCLEVLNGSNRQKAACEMLTQIDPRLMEDKRIAYAVCSVIEESGLKELSKMGIQTLRQCIRYYPKSANTEPIKIRLVMLGELLKENLKSKIRAEFSDYAKTDLKLQTLNSQDYLLYIKSYLSDFVSIVSSQDDITKLIKMFNGPNASADAQFASEYISAVKRREKTDRDKWSDIVAWTSSYALSHKAENEALYKELVRYLRTLKEEDAETVRRGITALSGDTACGRLFEDVQKKEGLQEKLGNIFKKRKP